MLTPAWDLTGSTLGTTSFNFPSPTTHPLLSSPHLSLSPAGTVSPNIPVAAQRAPSHHCRASHPHQRRVSHPHQCCATHHCRRALHPHRCRCRRTSHPHHRCAHHLHHRRAPHQRCALHPHRRLNRRASHPHHRCVPRPHHRRALHPHYPPHRVLCLTLIHLYPLHRVLAPIPSSTSTHFTGCSPQYWARPTSFTARSSTRHHLSPRPSRRRWGRGSSTLVPPICKKPAHPC